MTKIIKQIPNAFTLFNLFCGILAIVFTLDQRTIIYSPYLIFLGGLFDFLDGMMARMLKAYSEIGKQLDSLADLVTFGVAPAILAFSIMKLSFIMDDPLILFNGLSILQYILLFISLLIPVFSAIRLAKFNIDETQTDHFRGLPTPASAFLIASIALAYFNYNKSLVCIIGQTPMLFAGIILLDCILMVSNIRIISLKFKNLSVKDNFDKYLLVLVAAGLFYFFLFEAFAIIILFYIVLSVVMNYVKKVS